MASFAAFISIVISILTIVVSKYTDGKVKRGAKLVRATERTAMKISNQTKYGRIRQCLEPYCQKSFLKPYYKY